ncbi:hypothetical protein CC80DRAFT_560876 [Byssothecium circinans]|uniref:Uncharacterized protein n=1 Tax=Byssothecium circinans TaxID=147558 RepID=A0A6A5TXB7_9PLEO|nr:hypothetical protein CC80DRAFT_560876 [Byssothecium circinans]
MSSTEHNTIVRPGPIVAAIVGNGLLAAFNRCVSAKNNSAKTILSGSFAPMPRAVSALEKFKWECNYLAAHTQPSPKNNHRQATELTKKDQLNEEMATKFDELEVKTTVEKFKSEAKLTAHDQVRKRMLSRNILLETDLKMMQATNKNLSASHDRCVQGLQKKIKGMAAAMESKDKYARAEIARKNKHIQELEAMNLDYEDQLDKAQMVINQLNSEARDHKEQLEAAKTEAAGYNAQHEEQSQQMDKLREELSKRRKQRTEIGSKIIDLKNERNRLNYRVKVLKEALVDATKANDNASSSNSTLSTSPAAPEPSVSTETSASLLEIEPLDEDIINAFEASQSKILDALRATQRQSEELKTKKSELSRKISHLRHQVRTAGDAMEADLAAFQHSKPARRHTDCLNRENFLLQSQRDALQKKVETLTHEVDGLSSSIGNSTNSASQDENIPLLCAQLYRLRQKYEEVEGQRGVAAEGFKEYLNKYTQMQERYRQLVAVYRSEHPELPSD